MVLEIVFEVALQLRHVVGVLLLVAVVAWTRAEAARAVLVVGRWWVRMISVQVTALSMEKTLAGLLNRLAELNQARQPVHSATHLVGFLAASSKMH